MALKEVYRVESAKWDAIAAQAAPKLTALPPTADFYSQVCTSPLLCGVADFLGDVRGKQVLEYGCGLGAISTLLARSGAEVISFDLSRTSVAVTRRRADLNAMDIGLAVAAGESLPYADESFDIVFGKAILHHLDVSAGAHDLYRVLRPGGKAVFAEPMGMNPFLNLGRARIWYPNKHPRGADRPLTYEEIYAWGRQFSEFHFREVQLLSMAERAFGFGKKLTFLRRLDDLLLDRVPALRRYCRYVVMFMVK
ncbi:MAG: methyltransferase domain-containing protein [Roseiflexaceae bacterium]